MLDNVNVADYIKSLKAAIKQFKTKITKHLNSNRMYQFPVADVDRIAAYRALDVDFKLYCADLLQHAKMNKRAFAAASNIGKKLLADIHCLIRSPYDVVVCDKGYGIEAALHRDVQLNCYRILEGAHYKTEHREEAAIQRQIYVATLKVYDQIRDEHPAYRISASTRCRRSSRYIKYIKRTWTGSGGRTENLIHLSFMFIVNVSSLRAHDVYLSEAEA